MATVPGMEAAAVTPDLPVTETGVDVPWARTARKLFEAVSSCCYDARPVFEQVLAPAMPAWSGFAAAFGHYRHLATAPAPILPADPDGGLMTFYALSRVFEHLLFGIQDRAGLGRHQADWPAVPPSSPTRAQFVQFFGALGMAPMAPRAAYHPFFHEVASAVPDPTLGSAVLVEEELWPGFLFGDMVFARAGVRVRCGPDAPVDPALAARTTLYWAWCRVHRDSCDLSHGWGSNSQWSTNARRDYRDGGMLRYNVEGCVRLTGDDAILLPHAEPDDLEGLDDLPPPDRLELLRHRCLVRTHKPHADRWPFDDTYAEPAP